MICRRLGATSRLRRGLDLALPETGNNDVVFALEDIVVVDAVRVVLGPADGSHGGAVKAESHRLAPTVGTVAGGPVDGLVIEENHVTFFRRDGDGFELVGMILVGREVGGSVGAEDMHQGAVLMAARHDTQGSALQRCIVEMEKTIDEVGAVVRVEWIILVHRERSALFRWFAMQYGVVPLDGTSNKVLHTACEAGMKKRPAPSGGVEVRVMHEYGLRRLAFLLGQIAFPPGARSSRLSPRPTLR